MGVDSYVCTKFDDSNKDIPVIEIVKSGDSEEKSSIFIKADTKEEVDKIYKEYISLGTN